GSDGSAGSHEAGTGDVDANDIVEFGGHGLDIASGIAIEAKGDDASASGDVKGGGNTDGLRVGSVVVVDLDGIGAALVVGDRRSGIAVEGEADDDRVARRGVVGKLEVVAVGAGKPVVARVGAADVLHELSGRGAAAT